MKNRILSYVLLFAALIAALFLPAWYVTGPDVPTNAVSSMAIMFNFKEEYAINHGFAIPVVSVLGTGIALGLAGLLTKKEEFGIAALAMGLIASIANFVCGLVAIAGYGDDRTVTPLGYISLIIVIAALVLFVKYMPKDERPMDENYIEFSMGAIEIDGNKLTIYHNWLPFTFFRFGRFARVMYINDIQSVYYKGPGWFPGIICFYFKHFNFNHGVLITKHFFWRQIAFNKKMEPFYQNLLKKISENNNN